MITDQNTVNIFICSVPEDEDFLRHLEKHLGTLRRNSFISLWSKRLIVPGIDWAREIDQQREQASIVLLLVNADFLWVGCLGYPFQKEASKMALSVPSLRHLFICDRWQYISPQRFLSR